MFEDEKIRLIDVMPNGVMVIYVWIRLLVQAGKINAGGYIYLSENISYTEEMLATLFCKPLESIKYSLKTLCDFQMIEIDSNNIIKILNWEKHQNIEGMERVRAQNRSRVQNHREKAKQIEKDTKDNNEGEPKESNNSGVEQDNSCNDIKNKSNVTVTNQNKSESKKEIENKNENESESENKSKNEIENRNKKNSDAANKKDLKYQESESINDSKAKNSRDSEVDIGKKSIDIKAMELLKYYEKITGKVASLNFGAVKLAIDIHGENQVKLAIDRALEVNKPDMTYINGILKNWRREGYPNQREESKNGVRITGKSNVADKNEFTGFKPKKPRNLTEDERKSAEEKLI